MERNEVIKALECCVKVGGYRDAQICNDCPLTEKRCAILLPENALALINSQEQRIKELAEENERLRANCAKGANALIEEMQKNRTIEADTVRKMQEKLIKGAFCSACGIDYSHHIIQIAKEMLEGDNENNG